eukprot:948050-Amorphochlora_amoeboformis.AAC.1
MSEITKEPVRRTTKQTIRKPQSTYFSNFQNSGPYRLEGKAVKVLVRGKGARIPNGRMLIGDFGADMFREYLFYIFPGLCRIMGLLFCKSWKAFRKGN